MATAQSFDLHRAALEGQLHLIRANLETFSDTPGLAQKRVNAVDADKRTPLHWAASSGSLEIVKLLVGHGAELEIKDESGWTPLMIASSAGNVDVVEELLHRGANPQATNLRGQTSLHYAASKGKTDVGRALLSKGADVNARDGANQVSLHRAASAGHDAFVRLLLNPPPLPPAGEGEGEHKPRAKTRVNPQDRLGNTPLHLAMESGNASTAVVLIEEGGADRDRTNADGQRPEEVEGLRGQEQRRARDYVVSRVGPLDGR